jgi:hypothetical protein
MALPCARISLRWFCSGFSCSLQRKILGSSNVQTCAPSNQNACIEQLRSSSNAAESSLAIWRGIAGTGVTSGYVLLEPNHMGWCGSPYSWFKCDGAKFARMPGLGHHRPAWVIKRHIEPGVRRGNSRKLRPKAAVDRQRAQLADSQIPGRPTICFTHRASFGNPCCAG